MPPTPSSPSAPSPPSSLTSSTSPNPSRESLSEQFTRLCLEIPTPPPTPSPILPGLTPTESAHLRLNSSSQLYLIPPPAQPPPPSFLKAYRHALAHIFSNGDPSLYTLLLSHPTLTPPNSQPTPPPLPPPPPLKYPQLRTLTWSNSLSRQTLDSFTQSWRAKRAAQIAADNLEAQQALARAQSTNNPRLSKPSPPQPSTRNPLFNFTADSVLWAAQEEAAASSVLRELRTSLAKWRKGSSKAPPERSALWSLVAQKNTKLKPEAAAEMARARVAAAAAVAVMKEVKEANEGGPADSLGDLGVDAVQYGMDHVRILEGGAAGDDLVVCPGFPRALSLDSGKRMRNISKKKKKVAFVEGTMFGKGN